MFVPSTRIFFPNLNFTNQLQRTGKSSACNVVKVADNSSVRPSGPFIRNKLNSIDETVPRMIAIRQPKGPEGKGFTAACRAVRLPGMQQFFLIFSYPRFRIELNLFSISLQVSWWNKHKLSKNKKQKISLYSLMSKDSQNNNKNKNY